METDSTMWESSGGYRIEQVRFGVIFFDYWLPQKNTSITKLKQKQKQLYLFWAGNPRRVDISGEPVNIAAGQD